MTTTATIYSSGAIINEYKATIPQDFAMDYRLLSHALNWVSEPLNPKNPARELDEVAMYAERILITARIKAAQQAREAK